MLKADWQLTGPLLALWPYRRDVWRGMEQRQAAPVQQQMLAMLRTIQSYHPVYLGVHPAYLGAVRRQLKSEFSLIPIAYDDAWARDIAPLWSQQQHLIYANCFDFTAWNGLYPDPQRDQSFAPRVARLCHKAFRRHALVVEAGMISSNGAGLSLLNIRSLRRNNPTLSLVQLRHRLKALFPEEQFIELNWAYEADETGGHMDNLAQFISEDTLAIAELSAHLTKTRELQQWLAQLKQFRGADGRELKIIELPAAMLVSAHTYPLWDVQLRKGVKPRWHQPILASYANFIRIGNMLLLPQYGRPEDQTAQDVLSSACPELRIIPISAHEFIAGGGGPHCLTANLPA